MAVLETYTDLPIFDPERELLYRSDSIAYGVNDAVARGETTVLRRCLVDAFNCRKIGITCLADLLEAVERDFDQMKADYGWQVVPHEWGYFPLSAVFENHDDSPSHQALRARYQIPNTSAHYFLPPGYLLAAAVEIIKPDLPANCNIALDRRDILADTVIRYRTAPGPRFRLYDISTDQFVHGKPITQPGQASAPYLVDIEPRADNW